MPPCSMLHVRCYSKPNKCWWPAPPPAPPRPDALRNMITNSVSNNAISYGSLKCFVWVFDIAPANSQYNDINVTTGQLNRPVTKYVIKVVITNPTKSRDMPNRYVDPITGTSHIKSSDSINSLVEEANTQQLAWIKTFSQGVYVECPSVASLCFFDNQNGKNFVNFYSLFIYSLSYYSYKWLE